MAYVPAPAPDAVLARIVYASVADTEIPFGDLIVGALGRSASVEELRRMGALLEAGRRAVDVDLQVAEAALCIAEEREAAGQAPLGRDELEAAALARLGS